jgi:hypothetical protein
MREFAIDFEHRGERDEPRAVRLSDSLYRFNAWQFPLLHFWIFLAWWVE